MLNSVLNRIFSSIFIRGYWPIIFFSCAFLVWFWFQVTLASVNMFRSISPLLLFQFSSVASNFLRPHGLQHGRPPCPSWTPGVYSNSCPLSWWYIPTISSSVIPFSSYLQWFPASGSFQMSQFFASGGQSIGVSASASVLPVNIQDWFPLGWTGWISLQSKGLWRVSPTPQFKSISSSVLSFLYSPTHKSIYYWKNQSFN